MHLVRRRRRERRRPRTTTARDGAVILRITSSPPSRARAPIVVVVNRHRPRQRDAAILGLPSRPRRRRRRPRSCTASRRVAHTASRVDRRRTSGVHADLTILSSSFIAPGVDVVARRASRCARQSSSSFTSSSSPRPGRRGDNDFARENKKNKPHAPQRAGRRLASFVAVESRACVLVVIGGCTHGAIERRAHMGRRAWSCGGAIARVQETRIHVHECSMYTYTCTYVYVHTSTWVCDSDRS